MSQDRDLVVLASFQQSIEAEIVAGRLQADGIESFVQNEYSVTLRPHLAQALGGIKLQVMRKDYEAARAILDEASQTQQNEPVGECPSCSSTHTEKVERYSPKSLFNLVTFPIVFSLFRKSRRCKDCGESFR
jgi:hypothetical protein